MRAGRADREDRAIDLRDHRREPVPGFDANGLAVLERIGAEVEPPPLARNVRPRLPVHAGAIPEHHLAAQVREYGHQDP